MHMFSKEKHFYGGHGIVGAQVPLGTGLAFANRIAATTTSRLTYFGDGAANQGQVYESFNMAALWKLPVVYIIENNRYAMGTSVERASAQTDFSKRGAVLQHSRRAGRRHGRARGQGRRRARRSSTVPRGQGPYILEMQTYRYRGHSMSDPAKYRTKEEVQKMRDEHDPIEQVRARAARGRARRSTLGDEDESSPRSRSTSEGPRDRQRWPAEFATGRRSRAGSVRALDRRWSSATWPARSPPNALRPLRRPVLPIVAGIALCRCARAIRLGTSASEPCPCPSKS
jgi:hypothetical protein